MHDVELLVALAIAALVFFGLKLDDLAAQLASTVEIVEHVASTDPLAEILGASDKFDVSPALWD